MDQLDFLFLYNILFLLYLPHPHIRNKHSLVHEVNYHDSVIECSVYDREREIKLRTAMWYIAQYIIQNIYNSDIDKWQYKNCPLFITLLLKNVCECMILLSWIWIKIIMAISKTIKKRKYYLDVGRLSLRCNI